MKTTYAFCCIFLIGCALLASGCGSTPTTTSQKSTPVAAQKTAVPTATATSAATATLAPTPTAQAVDEPVSLSIPVIKVNTQIEQVSITDKGDLGTPTLSQWDNVGWYSAGTHPGNMGSAVIDGHLDRPGGGPAVFWNLRNIHAGDVVQITTKSGQVFSFHVTRTALYAPQEAPLQEIFGDTGGKYLNLITCAGDWLPDQHQTTQRMVVYTTLD